MSRYFAFPMTMYRLSSRARTKLRVFDETKPNSRYDVCSWDNYVYPTETYTGSTRSSPSPPAPPPLGCGGLEEKFRGERSGGQKKRQEMSEPQHLPRFRCAMALPKPKATPQGTHGGQAQLKQFRDLLPHRLTHISSAHSCPHTTAVVVSISRCSNITKVIIL